MKKYVVLGIAVLCAGAALAATADVSPSAVGATPPGFYNPAWGSLVRSYTATGGGTGTYTGVACTSDGYVIHGTWSGWSAFTVYTTTGSFVRSVAVSTTTNGYRDGTGKNHLGSSYIVTMQLTPYSYPYTAGGTPGGSGTVLFSGPAGRGIGWDGTYYYATTGSFGTPIGVYTSTGSQVRTFTGSWAANLYGVAAFVPANGYVYVANQSPHYVAEVDSTSGSIIRSFTEPCTSEGGIDFGWSDGYIYLVNQTAANSGTIYVYDSALSNAVQPASLGKLKAIYR